MTRELVLVLGGARAGKSAFAQGLAENVGNVLFVATAEAGDAEMAERIARHRASRPAHWVTLEEPLNLPAALAKTPPSYDAVILDCLTLWVSNLLLQENQARDPVTAAERLLEAYEEGTASWIVVSNEVGLGLVPPTPLGREYRDALGRVNQIVARRADRVYLMVAGLAMDLKSLGAGPAEHLGP